jgi:hypothetical protein
MAKSRKTSAGAAKAASRVLRDGRTSKAHPRLLPVAHSASVPPRGRERRDDQLLRHEIDAACPEHRTNWMPPRASLQGAWRQAETPL